MTFYLFGKPYKRGFFCNDESLHHPFQDSTVTSSMLYVIGGLLPVATVSHLPLLPLKLHTCIHYTLSISMSTYTRMLGMIPYHYPLSIPLIFFDRLIIDLRVLITNEQRSGFRKYLTKANLITVMFFS